MLLLDGATITVREATGDEARYGKYIAAAGNFWSGKQAQDDDLVQAIGLAVLLQSGYTESGVKRKLEKERGHV